MSLEGKEAIVSIINNPEELRSEPPRPLIREAPPADPFPVDALGPILGPAAADMHERVQCPLAISAQSVLAAATLASQGHADVQLPTSHLRPLSNFFVTIAETGERKTTADAEALWSIRKREQTLREEYDSALPDYENETLAWDKARELATRGAQGSDRDAIKRALDTVGPAPMAPLLPMLTCPEPTYEGLCKYLRVGQPSMGVFSSEGGQFIGGHGMSDDNKLRTAAGLSGLWDGEPVKRVRAGDGTSILAGRRVAMHLMAQPDVAAILLSDRMLLSQGLLSRCLVTAPESIAGTRFWRERPASTCPAVGRYSTRLLDLLELPLPVAQGKRNELTPRTLKLDPDARKVWIGFVNFVERRLSAEGPLASVRGLANKIPEHSARLAAVLALMSDPQGDTIVGEQMEGGINLAQHYLSEALRLFEASQISGDLRLAQRLQTWLLLVWDEPLISLPDIYQYGPNAVRDKQTAAKLVTILEDHGWLIREKSGGVVRALRRRDVWRTIRP
jgi:hypothetical protein